MTRPAALVPAADPREEARQVEREHPGWAVWWGLRTGRFLAIHRGVPDFVIAITADEMTEKIMSWELVMR